MPCCLCLGVHAVGIADMHQPAPASTRPHQTRLTNSQHMATPHRAHKQPAHSHTIHSSQTVRPPQHNTEIQFSLKALKYSLTGCKQSISYMTKLFTSVSYLPLNCSFQHRNNGGHCFIKTVYYTFQKPNRSF